MNNILLNISLLSGLLSNQLKPETWKRTIKSWVLRFVCMSACLAYSGAILKQLYGMPTGSYEFLINHMFEPLGAFMMSVVVVFFLLGTYSAYLAGKFKEAL